MDITKEMLIEELKSRLLPSLVVLGKKLNYTIKTIKFKTRYIEIIGRAHNDYNFGVYINGWDDFDPFIIKDDKLVNEYYHITDDKFSKGAGIPVATIETVNGKKVEVPHPNNWKNNVILYYARLFYLGYKQIEKEVTERKLMTDERQYAEYTYKLDDEHIANISFFVHSVIDSFNRYGTAFTSTDGDTVTVEEI